MSDAEAIRELTRDRTAVVLVTASWCGPCLPAPTVLRELDRRWGGAVHAVLLEDAPDAVLDQLAVEVLPVWLQLTPGEPDGGNGKGTGTDTGAGTGAEADARDLAGTASTGSPVLLPGKWEITGRYDGALPKHDVDARFGPGGTRTD